MNIKNKKKRNKNNKRHDLHNHIMQRKNDEIESLKSRISSLEIDCEKKDELIDSIDSLRSELNEITEELSAKSDEYDMLIADLWQMRKVFNQELYKGRWKFIRFLMR